MEWFCNADTVLGLCLDGSSCPADKPFCTSVGCVFRCPRPFYIRDTNCVVDCGDRFVDSKTNQCVETCPDGHFVNDKVAPLCVSVCPDPYYTNGTDCVSDCGNWFVSGKHCVKYCPDGQYITETLNLIGTETYMERECTYMCDYGMYIINDTCVHTCPSDLNYISVVKTQSVKKQYCLPHCPLDQPFKLNFSSNDINYHKCLEICDTFIENGFCTEVCPPGKIVFNSTCVDACPSSNPILSDDGICFEMCNNTKKLISPECRCPKDKQFLYNGACASVCEPPYEFINTAHGIKICEDACRTDTFIFNKTVCVELCPIGTYLNQRECTSKCPATMPYTCQAKKGTSACMKEPTVPTHTVCLKKCPQTLFIENSSCIASCPKHTINGSNICVDSCPIDRQYSMNVSTGVGCNYWNNECDSVNIKVFQCVEKCPTSTFVMNNSCVDFCPDGYHLSNRTCVLHCPDSLLRRKKTYSYTVWKSRYMYSILDRVEHIETSRIGLECMSKCSDTEVFFNSTCATKCPTSHKYASDGICQQDSCRTPYMYNLTTYFSCTNSCKKSEYINKNICVNQCPISMFVLGRTCVDKCPNDNKLVTNITETCSRPCRPKVYSACASSCQEDMYLLNDTCVSICPKPYLVFNKTCVLECPDIYPYMKYNKSKEKVSTECVQNCNVRGNPLDRDTLTCVNSCPASNSYVLDNVCTSKCPDAKLLNKELFGIECVDKCPIQKPEFNRTCQESCPIHRKYNFNGMCVSSCPPQSPLSLLDEKNRCIKTCVGEEKIFLYGYCVDNYSCNHTMAKFEGQCLAQCEGPYMWYEESCIHIGWLIALNILSVLIATPLIIFSRKLLADYFTIIRMCFCQTDKRIQTTAIVRNDSSIELHIGQNDEVQEHDEVFNIQDIENIPLLQNETGL